MLPKFTPSIQFEKVPFRSSKSSMMQILSRNTEVNKVVIGKPPKRRHTQLAPLPSKVHKKRDMICNSPVLQTKVEMRLRFEDRVISSKFKYRFTPSQFLTKAVKKQKKDSPIARLNAIMEEF